MLPTESPYALAPWRRRLLVVCFAAEIALLAYWLATWNDRRELASLYLYLAMPLTLGAVFVRRSQPALHWVLIGLSSVLLGLYAAARYLSPG